ncbi:uncharacterized protein TA08310 [Theileria annulata]|uniref:Uncharacterized protein n=1 Tax=Theileria annulata TaxID=5874 RepID=Q4U9Q0_THEAN|nr:uncharacterized protein TA08310 [Theileria annulata]CAI76453.1 hypothetical protein TA08310 [Theileria annulata]|eukprot:XP_953078.1 hypothetical protein TA08310 [Theileria annulata]
MATGLNIPNTVINNVNKGVGLEFSDLGDKSEKIFKVLKNSKESFENYFNLFQQRNFNSDLGDVFPDVRVDNLDRVLSRLKLALNLLNPSVKEVNRVLSEFSNLTKKVDEIREITQNIEFSDDFIRLSEIENSLNNNYLKLNSVEKLKLHLNPLIPNVDITPSLSDKESLEEISAIITASEQLKISKQFCENLNQFLQKTESTDYKIVNESLSSINKSFDHVCQLCFEVLCKEMDRISVLSSRLNCDSGVINEPLINIPNTQDTLNIISIFEDHDTQYATNHNINTVNTNYGNDVNHPNNTDPVNRLTSMNSLTSINRLNTVNSLNSVTEQSYSMRLLKIMITSGEKLEQLLSYCIEFLSNLSRKRYSALLQYIKPKNRDNNSVYDVFMNLQLVISLIKSSVISLYTNCELDLYTQNHQDFKVLTAQEYIHKVTETLIPLLENKLDTIITHDSVVSEDEHITDVTENITIGPVMGLNEIVELYTAIQICHFYYNKISNILKPPYLQVYNTISSFETFNSSSLTKNTSVLGSPNDTLNDTPNDSVNNVDGPVLISFNRLCNNWNEMIMLKLQKSITIPLSSQDFKGHESEVLNTIANFLSEIVSIQLEYSVSDDLVTILEMTINPVINWCQRVSNSLPNGYIFLLNSYSTLLSSIQSPLVDKSFKLLLEELKEFVIESLVNGMIPTIITALGGKLIELESHQVESNDTFLHNVKSVIFTDGILEFVPSEQLSQLDSTNLKSILKRIYIYLAKVYQTNLNDDISNKLITLSNTYS